LLAIVPLGLAAIVGMNLDFYRLLARRHGWTFAISAVPLHYVYYCCCGLSVLIAEAIWRFPARRPKVAEPADAPAAGIRKDQPGGTPVPLPSADRVRRPTRWTQR
jgi:hypothetical protein